MTEMSLDELITTLYAARERVGGTAPVVLYDSDCYGELPYLNVEVWNVEDRPYVLVCGTGERK